MKRFYTAVVLVAAALLSACVEEERPEVVKPQTEMKISATRPAFEGITAGWIGEEKLGMVSTASTSQNSPYLILPETISADGLQAEFDGAALAPGAYVVYYPYCEKSPVSVEHAFDLTGHKQTGNSNVHLAAYDFAYSDVVELQRADTIEVALRRALAIQRFDISLVKKIEGVGIEGVVVMAHKPDGAPLRAFGESIYYDMASREVKASGMTSSVYVGVKEGAELTASPEDCSVWLLTYNKAPEYPYYIDVKVFTDHGEVLIPNVYEINSAADEFVAGELYHKTLSLEGGDVKYFPDQFFRQRLVSKYGFTQANGDIDIDDPKNAKILKELRKLAVSLASIASLDGIEYFTGMDTLACTDNKLARLDVSKNPKLKYLDCSYNQLTSLDLSKNTQLQVLSCSYNQLISLDISENDKLVDLYFQNNQLKLIDVGHLTDLKRLNVQNNQLTSFDVSANAELRSLDCSSNALTALDLSNNSKLYSLTCGSCQLSKLDVRSNPQLVSLECWDNELTELDLSHNKSLFSLYCMENKLTALDLSANARLETLNCYANDLTILDVSKNLELQYLNLTSNKISNIDVSKHEFLNSFGCGENFLTELDVRGNLMLTSLGCGGNLLTKLDISNNLLLMSIQCDGNCLATLDVTHLSALSDITCGIQQRQDLTLYLTAAHKVKWDSLWSIPMNNRNVIPVVK